MITLKIDYQYHSYCREYGYPVPWSNAHRERCWGISGQVFNQQFYPRVLWCWYSRVYIQCIWASSCGTRWSMTGRRLVECKCAHHQWYASIWLAICRWFQCRGASDNWRASTEDAVEHSEGRNHDSGYGHVLKDDPFPNSLLHCAFLSWPAVRATGFSIAVWILILIYLHFQLLRMDWVLGESARH